MEVIAEARVHGSSMVAQLLLLFFKIIKKLFSNCTVEVNEINNKIMRTNIINNNNYIFI